MVPRQDDSSTIIKWDPACTLPSVFFVLTKGFKFEFGVQSNDIYNLYINFYKTWFLYFWNDSSTILEWHYYVHILYQSPQCWKFLFCSTDAWSQAGTVPAVWSELNQLSAELFLELLYSKQLSWNKDRCIPHFEQVQFQEIVPILVQSRSRIEPDLFRDSSTMRPK